MLLQILLFVGLLVFLLSLYAIWWRIAAQKMANKIRYKNEPVKQIGFTFAVPNVSFKDLNARSVITWFFGTPCLSTIDIHLMKEVLFSPADNFKRITFVSDEQTLVASEGETAKRRRSAITKVFQTSLLEHSLTIINGIIQESLPEMKNDVIEIENPTKWSEETVTKIIATITYGLSGDELKKIIVAEETIAGLSISNLIHSFVPITIKLPLRSAKKQREAKITFDALEKHISELRKKFESDELDESLDEVTPSFLLLLTKIATNEKIPFTTKEVARNCINLGAGGNDSTSSAVVSTFYFLAKYPEYQEIATNEILNFIKTVNYPQQQLKLGNLNQLQYASQFIKESIRLNPPFMSTFIRTANKDLELADYFIPKGVKIDCSISKVHSSDLYWKNPQIFNPDRFEPELNKEMHPCAFMPFGAGARQCVAQRFAMIICKMFMFQILSEFKVEYLPEDITFKHNFGVSTPTKVFPLRLKKVHQ